MTGKIAIYTCITGGYDSIDQPAVISPDFDYICFVPFGTDVPENAGIWQVRRFDTTASSNVAKSRYPKMQPHFLLKDYDYSLYMDSNVRILSESFYSLIKQEIDEGVLFSAPAHPVNDCVYDEAEFILDKGKDSFTHICKAVHFLKSKGFPHHWGLFENNILLRKHLDKCVVNIDDMWWNLFEIYPKRDQLLLTYCMRENGLPLHYLLPGGANARTTDMLSLRPHTSATILKRPSFIIRKLSTFPKMALRFYINL